MIYARVVPYKAPQASSAYRGSALFLSNFVIKFAIVQIFSQLSSGMGVATVAWVFRIWLIKIRLKIQHLSIFSCHWSLIRIQCFMGSLELGSMATSINNTFTLEAKIVSEQRSNEVKILSVLPIESKSTNS